MHFSLQEYCCSRMAKHRHLYEMEHSKPTKWHVHQHEHTQSVMRNLPVLSMDCQEPKAIGGQRLLSESTLSSRGTSKFIKRPAQLFNITSSFADFEKKKTGLLKMTNNRPFRR